MICSSALWKLPSVQRNRTLSLVAVAGLAFVVGGGVAPLLHTGPDTFVGSKTFTEQYILADVIASKTARSRLRCGEEAGDGLHHSF